MPIAISEQLFRPVGDIMPGAIRLVSRLVIFALTWGMLGSGAGQGADVEADAENWNRLRSMPREQRLALWEELKEFDALGPTERSAIRALNAQIARLPVSEQANYWAVLSRYHHWVQGLSEQQRNELNSVPPNERMRLVTKLRAQERSAPSTATIPPFLQVIDFAVMSPFETAHRIKAWLELTPEQRAEIEAMPSQADQQKRLAELAQHVRLAPTSSRIPKAEEEALLAKIDVNPQLKNWLGTPEKKKADPAKHEKIKRRIAANFYFLEKPPAAVEPSRLMRFEAAMPPWYRGEFDHLPPEEARRRLTILYRLVYPIPSEIPEPPKATNPQGDATAPTAGTPRSTPPRPGTNPF
jgi:hypothetical protein